MSLVAEPDSIKLLNISVSNQLVAVNKIAKTKRNNKWVHTKLLKQHKAIIKSHGCESYPVELLCQDLKYFSLSPCILYNKRSTKNFRIFLITIESFQKFLFHKNFTKSLLVTLRRHQFITLAKKSETCKTSKKIKHLRF